MISSRSILFFADRLPPLIGGMEVHAQYFIEHFTDHLHFPLSAVVTKDGEGKDLLLSKEERRSIVLEELPYLCEPAFVFFNSGRWIEELEKIRNIFPKAIFIYRTGGNEILKAPLIRQQILDHSLRQSYWAKIINHSIDLLITNSTYTEMRLRAIQITCPFACCVGGVNAPMLNQKCVPELSEKLLTKKPIIIFCAARFVPYKNHSLMLSVIYKLLLRGHKLKVRFAGEGPLLQQMKEQVLRDDLVSNVEFLGVLDNQGVCREMVRADIYMQLSKDQVIEVPDGSYTHSEGMGRSILEALTAGIFVIAGQSGALSEIVTPDRGILVKLDNMEKIVDQVEAILENLPKRLPFFDRYSWINLFKRYEKILDNFHENITGNRKTSSK